MSPVSSNRESLYAFVISQGLSAFNSHVSLSQYKLHAHWPNYATLRESRYITYIWVFPLTPYQFIAEMKNPRDFPKGKSEAWVSYK